MAMNLGGCGPGWYMEGMAELFGTHTWDAQTGKLELGVMPASRAAAPYWGRIKLLKESYQPLSLPAVLALDNAAPMNNEAYAWVWSSAHFLEHHPRYAKTFHTLPSQVTRPEFNAQMQKLYGDDWPNLPREWELFTRRIDYGDDVACEAIDFGPTEELTKQGLEVKIDPRRGWHPTGVRVAKGDRLTVRGAGQFVIGREPTTNPGHAKPTASRWNTSPAARSASCNSPSTTAIRPSKPPAGSCNRFQLGKRHDYRRRSRAPSTSVSTIRPPNGPIIPASWASPSSAPIDIAQYRFDNGRRFNTESTEEIRLTVSRRRTQCKRLVRAKAYASG